MALFLTLLSGICWTLTYIASIRVGLRDKVYVMPFVALALNITWEALYAVTGLANSLANVQAWINLVWVAFDIGLLYIYFKYAKDEFCESVPKKYFVPWSILILVMCAGIQIAFMVGFDVASVDLGNVSGIIDKRLGAWYSAFTQNLVMSILYIIMFIKRKGRKGQSLFIAVNKCVGTFAPTILFGFIFHNNVVIALGLSAFVMDIIYIWMLLQGELFLIKKAECLSKTIKNGH